MFDITAIGEVLIDFKAVSEKGKLKMTGSLGGATCNVLAQAAKLGADCCFIGAVGNDVLGSFIAEEMGKTGVKSILQRTDSTTTMAVVSINGEGERSFDFIRSPGADSMIRFDGDVKGAAANSSILEYGSLSFSKAPAADTVFNTLEHAKGIRAYDPNLRPAIWKDDIRMKQFALKGMEYADILKIGDEEALFLTGETTLDCAAKKLGDKYSLPYIFITMGKDGCKYYCNDACGSVPSYAVKAVDTTGAGDSFFGALLYRYIKYGFNEENIRQSVSFACAAGAITASKNGTAEAMPFEDEITVVMKHEN